MPRKRSPERDRALAIYLEQDGKIANREIANQLGIPEKTIGGWKVKDAWSSRLNGVLQTVERSTPKRRAGAPRGNQNAKGNIGGHGGPPGNKKALKTGEHETIWLDALDDDERDLLDRMGTDAILHLDEQIQLLAIRARRMMLRIRNLHGGLTEKQRRILQERRKIPKAIAVKDAATGESKTVVRQEYDLVTTEVEETEMRPINDILSIEEALTRIQDKMLKALDLKHRMLGGRTGESDSLSDLARAIRASDIP